MLCNSGELSPLDSKLLLLLSHLLQLTVQLLIVVSETIHQGAHIAIAVWEDWLVLDRLLRLLVLKLILSAWRA